MDKLTLEDYKSEALGDKQLGVDTRNSQGQVIVGWHNKFSGTSNYGLTLEILGDKQSWVDATTSRGQAIGRWH